MTETPRKTVLEGIVELIDKVGIQGIDAYRFAYELDSIVCLDVEEDEWNEDAKKRTMQSLYDKDINYDRIDDSMFEYNLKRIIALTKDIEAT